MARSRAAKRPEGSIRQRGGTFQVRVYAGVDPVTGKANYLTESTRDEKEADRILRRLIQQVVAVQAESCNVFSSDSC